MKRKAAWVVVSLFIALCGSACGSFLFSGIPSGGPRGGVSSIFTTINSSLGSGPSGRILVSRSGSGNATLGTFAVHGRLSVKGSCSGHGGLDVAVAPRSAGIVDEQGAWCPSALDLNFGRYTDGGTEIRVLAPASAHWSVTIVERG